MPATPIGAALDLTKATRALPFAPFLAPPAIGNPAYNGAAPFPWGNPPLSTLNNAMAGYAFTPPPFAPGAGDPSVCGLLNELTFFPNGAAIQLLGSPFLIKSGVLEIQPTKATAAQAAAAALTSYLAGRPLYSGAMCTFPYGQLGGVFEFEFQAPNPMQPGRWLAGWLLPNNGQQTTELDVFEMVMSQAGVLSVTSSVHSSNAAYMAEYWSGPDEGTTTIPVAFDPSAAAHRYTVWVQPDYTAIFIDRACVLCYVTPPDFIDTTWYLIIDDTAAAATGWDGPLALGDTALPPSLWLDVGAYTGTIAAGSAAPPASTVTPASVQAQLAQAVAIVQAASANVGKL